MHNDADSGQSRSLARVNFGNANAVSASDAGVFGRSARDTSVIDIPTAYGAKSVKRCVEGNHAMPNCCDVLEGGLSQHIRSSCVRANSSASAAVLEQI